MRYGIMKYDYESALEEGQGPLWQINTMDRLILQSDPTVTYIKVGHRFLFENNTAPERQKMVFHPKECLIRAWPLLP